MATPKRQAQSPLDREEVKVKRRNIADDPPSLVSLEEIPDYDSQSDAETDLPSETLDDKDTGKFQSTLSTDEKVDKLIDRMDQFLECFHIMQKSSKKEQRSNTKKFKHLESAHNELI